MEIHTTASMNVQRDSSKSPEDLPFSMPVQIIIPESSDLAVVDNVLYELQLNYKRYIPNR